MTIRKSRSITLLLVLSTIFYGCAYKIPKENSSNNSFKPLTNQQNSNHDLDEVSLLGGKNLEWGLALSGGGIRSAAFSIGVMKALYDKQILQNIDVISAVSGGGYAAYWLLTSTTFEGEKGDSFGDVAFDNENFVANTCHLMTRANFVTYPNYANTLLKGQSRPDLYRCKIERSYGWNDRDIPNDEALSRCLKSDSQSIQISSLTTSVKNGEIPYFIFNTTIVNPESKTGWKDGLYEFTPLFQGNEAYGYKPWGDSPSLPLSQVSAISGAAVKGLLKQKVNNPHSAIDSETIELTDGGHSENLGVVALVRRGVRNIIVSDAELDTDLTFEGYYILKDRLSAWGLVLENELLDSRKLMSHKWWEGSRKWWERERTPELPEGNFIATVHEKNNPETVISTIHYVKMSVMGEIKVNSEKEYKGGLEEMYEAPESFTENARICDFLNTDDDKNGICDKHPLKACDSLTGQSFNGTEWIKQNAIIRISTEIDSSFPHKSTIDQSYYIDQFTSYMGLGYMQTQLLELSSIEKR